MSDIKVGILTFHRCINYGSYWQARCLAEGIQARGYNVVILDHDSPRINLAEWKCAYRPVLPQPVPASDFPLYREKIEKFFCAFESLPLSPRFPVDHPEAMPKCDIVVVGSDEVWNLSHPWYGKYPIFYGEGLRASHVVSYAASFGNYCATEGLHAVWAEKLKNFDMISVRDENSQVILRNAIGVEPEIVLDPCLQFPVNADDRQNTLFEEPYIAVYGHNFSTSFVESLRKWAGSRQLPLVSIGYRNDWADRQWLNADPHDFVHFIRHSEALATNFFHGCIFALANSRPFACEASSYRSNKLYNLMAKVKGWQHLITRESSHDLISRLLSEPVDASILENIQKLRQTSGRYLDNALKIKEFATYEQ